MKGFNLKYFVLFFFLLPEVLYSQSKITVTKPRLEVTDDNLTITYDILNAKSSDFFVVWIAITDVNGNKINAVSVSGDVGKDIKGGKNKSITWSFNNDSIQVDEELFVEVKAEKVVLQEETAVTKTKKTTEIGEETEIREELQTKGDPETKGETETREVNKTKDDSETQGEPETIEETKTIKLDEGNAGIEGISKGNKLLSSVVLPGWGQTKANKGRPYWLIGAAGYGCIAGSILLNRSASSAYDDYKSTMDLDESNALFNKATKRNSFSKILGYSAIGIWAADIIWVIATPVKSSMSTVTFKNRKLRITPGYDIGSNTGVVSLTYKF